MTVFLTEGELLERRMWGNGRSETDIGTVRVKNYSLLLDNLNCERARGIKRRILYPDSRWVIGLSALEGRGKKEKRQPLGCEKRWTLPYFSRSRKWSEEPATYLSSSNIHERQAQEQESMSNTHQTGRLYLSVYQGQRCRETREAGSILKQLQFSRAVN